MRDFSARGGHLRDGVALRSDLVEIEPGPICARKALEVLVVRDCVIARDTRSGKRPGLQVGKSGDNCQAQTAGGECPAFPAQPARLANGCCAGEAFSPSTRTAFATTGGEDAGASRICIPLEGLQAGSHFTRALT